VGSNPVLTAKISKSNANAEAMHIYFNDLNNEKMEDVNNALLHIKAKHNGEIPYQYGSRECAKLMHSYAVEYHQAKLKLLSMSDVVWQSEQLPQDKFCKVCNLPTDGEKCYSKKCPI
jgi:hypothetical protein